MQSLPQPLLESICEYIAYGEPHRRSLLAFASVSWACRAAALREWFSQVSIDVDDVQQFDQGLQKLERVLDETGSRACVRELTVGVRAVHRERDGSRTRYISERLYELRGWRPETDPRPDEWWEPLVRFLTSVHLQDLIWASEEQVPSCILALLQERMPRCRLHVHKFDLQSLHQEEPLKDIDDSEYIFATSPSLHRVIAPYSRHDASGRANYNEEASLRLVAGLTSNLKHVCMWDDTPRASGEIRSYTRRIRPTWRGFFPQSGGDRCEPPARKGQLQSLEIIDNSRVSEEQLVSWEAHTDFSVLTSLKLSLQVELGVLRFLANLAEYNGLRALKVLGLAGVDCEYEDREEANSAMKRMLLSLPPLKELSLVGIGGVVDSWFEAALAQHGCALEVFCVEDIILSPPQVVRLQESCPFIRELSIEILRSAGDAIEVGTYQTLGSMRYLESLSLVLQCTDYRPGEGPDDLCLRMGPSEDEEDQAAMALAIRQVFINAAVDESLARSIFETISAAHTSVRAEMSPRLSRMHLQVAGVGALNGQTMDSDFEGLIAWIGRSWLCRRDPRDTHRTELHVEEDDKNTRFERTQFVEEDMDEFYPNADQHTGIWLSLWPKTGAGWREDWRSFPLANDPVIPTGSAAVLFE